MPTPLELEQARLQQLRERGDPASLHQADQLDKLYHTEQMGALAQDVYHVAAGEHQPAPPGWTRLSEHPELLDQYAKKLGKTPDQLLEILHPDESGFRAEIYIPDAATQQEGFKTTLALKGSAGTVIGPDGKPRDTTAEDFGANNFPQSIGLETDYYDRAMGLGMDLKDSHIDFESTGHSLAGGMAAAVAATTHTKATTFNAAGLNPITTERFARQHPGVVVSKDLNHLITNYQVQGELLNDGVQGNIHNMDALRRQELTATLKETCDVLQRVPEAKDLLARQLGHDLPPYARGSIDAFVNKVATGNTDQLLRDLPLAAGEQHVLAAMTRDAHGALEPRVQVQSLPEITLLGAPVLESLAAVSAGAHVGERGGEVVAGAGHLEAQTLRATGRGVEGAADQVGTWAQAATQLEGAVARTGEHAVGATLAHARTAQAELSAQVDQGLGQAGRLGASLDAALLRDLGQVLPAQAQHELQAKAAQLDQAGREAEQRGAASAAADRRAGQTDAAAIHGATQTVETATQRSADAIGTTQHAVIGGAGHYAHAGLEATAQDVDGVARHAPAFLGTAGAVASLGVVAPWELVPTNYPRLAAAAEAISHGKQAGTEALDRHLMDTVRASLDAHTQSLERQADQSLQHDAPAQGRTASPRAAEPDPTRHQQRSLHGENSQVDRALEAQRQREVQGQTPTREAPPAPAAVVPTLPVPEREVSTPRHPPNTSEPNVVEARHAPAPAQPPAPAIDHAALAAQQAHHQAFQRHERQAREARERSVDPAAPTMRSPDLTHAVAAGTLAAAPVLSSSTPALEPAVPTRKAEPNRDEARESPERRASEPQVPGVVDPHRRSAPQAGHDTTAARADVSTATSAQHARVQEPAPPTVVHTPTLTPPLDPPALKDFRHPEHPLNARYEMFRDALGEQGFHHPQSRPTLNEAPEVRGYSAEQKDRLAAGFTAKLGTELQFNTEMQRFHRDGETLSAIEHPRELGARPLVLQVHEAQTLAHTPEQHAAAWRARELPAPEAVNTQRPDPRSLSTEHPGHPDHPRNAMYEHARTAVTQEYARWGMQKPAEAVDRDTMQVVTEARRLQMDDVGAVRLLRDGPTGIISANPHMAVYATADGPDKSFPQMAIVQSQTLQQAAPAAQAATMFNQVDQAMTQQQQANQALQAQINAQAPQAPGLGGPLGR